MHYMKNIIATAAVAVTPMLAWADGIAKVETEKTVSAAADALVTAIEGAGAKVFARVDHGAGAKSIGSDIGASELIIFGNPKVGTPAMEVNRLAGLHLPLKVLVYEDDAGKVWLAYETPAESLGSVEGIAPDAPILEPMKGALKNLTSKAAM
ncbi:DUF302 domain-containing protein [Neptunicoccus cionae]|uniref:DUF302 domain-containing protein n=1 Tax=Neptunicoccus cionae TaxID=2035344 RepID=A0A916VSM1_9RHOB|nr:DUF302 domain-containing protein [Amylibacter cionae]GGA30774.1 hypothetical protein GCM10011498_34900 [Amylibacter cionae]